LTGAMLQSATMVNLLLLALRLINIISCNKRVHNKQEEKQEERRTRQTLCLSFGIKIYQLDLKMYAVY